jgi:hypothetical protein
VLSLPCPEVAFLLTKAPNWRTYSNSQPVLGCLGFICFLTFQLHKGKYKFSKSLFIYQQLLYAYALLMLQIKYLEVEPIAKQYGIKNDVLFGM